MRNVKLDDFRQTERENLIDVDVNNYHYQNLIDVDAFKED